MGSDGLAVGTAAPSVSGSLVAPDGTVEERSLESLYTEQPVLLCFYTNDFSPDCIAEWCSFRDFAWFANGEHVQVVGSSASRVTTHQRFIDYLDLTFPLFSDRDLAIADSFGVKYRAFKLFARSRRSCFLIDGDGVIRYKWVGEHKLDPTRDTPPVSEVHEAIQRELDLGQPNTFGFDDEAAQS